ncbi:cytochrome P450 [Tricladium varicosporioides]|nr:cytochrome P450 [Hymenoscyphus varicosporioides]
MSLTIYFLLSIAIASLILGFKKWWTRRRRISSLGGKARTAGELPLGLDIAFYLIRSWLNDGLVEYTTGVLNAFGRTVDVKILGFRLVFTDAPENFEAIMSTKFAEYGKGSDLHRTWENLMGDSIFATDGQTWEASKRLLRPHLSKSRPSDFARTEHHVQQLFSRIHENPLNVNISDLSSRFALDVVSDIFLEESANSLNIRHFPFGEAMDKIQAYNTIRTVFGHLGSLLPTIVVRDSMQEVENYLDTQVKRILGLPSPKSDEKEAEGNKLVDSLRQRSRSKKDIRDQIIAVLLAGRDPFGLSLAWALYELARNPDVVQRLRSEIADLVRQGYKPTLEELHKMTYLKNIVQEVLRLYPPLGFNVRVALEDTYLPSGGGKDGLEPVGILKNTQIAYSVHSLQRRVDIVGADANIFRPERWESWQPGKWEYLPFNHGPRVCLGRNFSIIQLRYTLCRIFQEFDYLSSGNDANANTALRVELNIKPASPVVNQHTTDSGASTF